MLYLERQAKAGIVVTDPRTIYCFRAVEGDMMIVPIKKDHHNISHDPTYDNIFIKIYNFRTVCGHELCECMLADDNGMTLSIKLSNVMLETKDGTCKDLDDYKDIEDTAERKLVFYSDICSRMDEGGIISMGNFELVSMNMVKLDRVAITSDKDS